MVHVLKIFSRVIAFAFKIKLRLISFGVKIKNKLFYGAVSHCALKNCNNARIVRVRGAL